MRQCWRCGGELTPYSLRCSWCGRSTFVSAFFQVATLAVLLLGALFMTGVLPRDRLEAYLPFLREDDAWSARPVNSSADGAVGAAGGPAVAPGGYGSPATVPADGEPPAEPAARSEVPRAPQPARPGCDSPAAVHRLASRYPGWSRSDIALIACGRVRRGFTAGQVRAARGEPISVTEPAPGVEVWSYAAGDVTFAGAVVVAAD